jgi:DNA-binding NarL/FixJ family response regulator
MCLIDLGVEKCGRYTWRARAECSIPWSRRVGGDVVHDPAREFSGGVAVADELALVRAGIAAVCERRGLDVVAHTRSGRELVTIATVDRPELVVVGVPADLDVAEVVRRLVKLQPRPSIITLIPPAHDHLVRYVLALGADAVALRTTDVDELGEVIDAVGKGVQYVARPLYGALSGAAKLPPLAERTDEILSAREREVLVLLAEGRTNREIASTLSVTLATVKSHLVRIYAKLEASTRNEALGRAVSLGLLRS